MARVRKRAVPEEFHCWNVDGGLFGGCPMRYGDRECEIIQACVSELAVCLPLYENDLLEILHVLDDYHEDRVRKRSKRAAPPMPMFAQEMSHS